MAGRVPVGSHRTAVAKEMEAIFVQNLTYAADILSKVGPTYQQHQQNAVKLDFCSRMEERKTKLYCV